MKSISNDKGVALLIAIFSIGLLSFIALELSFDTTVRYVSSSKKIDVLKARYAAKAGVKLALLRISIFNQVKKQMGGIKGFERVADKVWNLPLSWPISTFLQGLVKLDSAQLKKIKTVEEESFIKGGYLTSISPLTGKIDLNLFSLPHKKIHKSLEDILVPFIQNRIEEDENLKEKFQALEIPRLIHHIIDWVDQNKTSVENGDEEQSQYLVTSAELPPNRPFKTFKEVLMVKDMTSELFDLIKDYVTIHGASKISANYIDPSFLYYLNPNDLNREEILNLFKTTAEAPFPDVYYQGSEEFFESIVNAGGLEEEKKKALAPFLSFDAPSNYLITSTGNFGDVNVSFSVVVVDENAISEKTEELVIAFEEPEQEKKKKDSKKKRRKTQGSSLKVVSWEEN